MNIDRPMVSLFFEIKRNLPYATRADMKIAAPDVGDRLLDIYQSSDDESLKALIESFLQRAGGDWTKRMVSNKKPKLSFYRRAVGQ
ncbi:MAG: hypothetical protein ACI9FR_000429 [Cryomorphaceae bacterium]|jgi:hypothetical protein